MQLQVLIQGGQPASAPDFDLWVWCAKYEAQVAELQKGMKLLQEVNALQSFALDMEKMA